MPAWPCSVGSCGSWRRRCSAWPSARWWASWPAGPSASTTSRSPGHRRQRGAGPARDDRGVRPRLEPPGGGAPAVGLPPGAHLTRRARRPPRPGRAGAAAARLCRRLPPRSGRGRASGSAPSTSAAPTPSASCSSSSATRRCCWAPSLARAGAPAPPAGRAGRGGRRLRGPHRRRGGRGPDRSSGARSPRPCAAAGWRRAASDVFVERLLGLTLTRAQVERGRAFVERRDRAGRRRRAGRLWQLGASPAHAGRGRRPRPVAGPPRGGRRRAARRADGPSAVGRHWRPRAASGSGGGSSLVVLQRPPALLDLGPHPRAEGRRQRLALADVPPAHDVGHQRRRGDTVDDQEARRSWGSGWARA